jgi:ribosomal protein S18 acetylase RimI-like enzyme
MLRGMPDPATSNLRITIRSYQLADKEACQKLYLEGLIGGRIAPSDQGLDIDNIPAAYFAGPESHFWVAENARGEIVGTVGVQQSEPGVGQIRRLRVRQDSRRRGVGSSLMETAVKFCREQQFLKITLDTFMEREPAIHLFEKFHFNHSRTRKVGEKELLYFYLDLYQTDLPNHKH